MTDILTIYAPVERWLALLADGWRFPDDIAQPMHGPHGAWSVFMWRQT